MRDTIGEMNAEVVRLYGAGDYGAALETAKRSAALAARELSDRDPLVAQCQHNLAELHLLYEEFKEAAACAQRAVEIRADVAGKMSPEYATSLTTLAKIYDVTGFHRKAEPL